MNRSGRAWRIASSLACALLCLGALTIAQAGSTHYTDSDNENNANTHVADDDLDVPVGRREAKHPIEFNIDVPALPKTSARLTIRANDVDEEQGETDLVYLNGTRLGRLSGANDVWNSTVFDVNPALIRVGRNQVRINVDAGSSGWRVTIDSGQLLIDGGAKSPGHTGAIEIVNHSVTAGLVRIDSRSTVNASTAGTYRMEVSVVNPAGETTSVLSRDFTVDAGTTLRSEAPTYMLSDVSGTYAIQAQLFYLDPANGNFPVQQDVARTTFEHVQNVGPTNPISPCLSDPNSAACVALDSDGDGLANAQEDALGTSRTNIDSDGDDKTDAVEVGANPAAPVDTDSDGKIDALEPADIDADADGVNDELDLANTNPCVPDAQVEACLQLDDDRDGIPDEASGNIDGNGRLETAVRGVGAFEPLFVFALLALYLLRRSRAAPIVGAFAIVALLNAPTPARADDDPSKGVYVGADAGLSCVEPRDRGGGYRIDDKTSAGFRLLAGYAWSPTWSAEAFYVDGGEAGVSSDNAAIGHLGTIDYRSWGAGLEWAPFEAGRNARFYPLLKIGAVHIHNSTDDARIRYKRVHSIGLYFGAGAAWRFSESWRLQGELVSYDKDELFASLGIRKHW